MRIIIINISLVIGLFLVLGIDSASAQKKPKYETVLPSLLNMNQSSAIAELLEYRMLEPDNASVYLQLGLLYYDRFQKSDPLLEYKRAMANIELAESSFGSMQVFINEKEVKKDKKLYLNFAQYNEKGKYEVSYDSIIAKTTRALDSMGRFAENMPEVYNNFTKSYAHYSMANQVFTELIGEHRTIKQLYLLYDEEMARKFVKIKENYNQSMDFFSNYVSRSDTFEVGYRQAMVVHDIDLYRLDGLAVEINFLEEEIEIWNYTKWVDEVEVFINSEIAALRVLMIQNEKLIANKLKLVNQDYSSHDFEPLIVSKELLFTIRKYDLNSVVEPLFKYKEYEHSIQYYDLLEKDFQKDEKMTLDRKMGHYSEALHVINKGELILGKIEKQNTELSYQKYSSFLDEYYSGVFGVTKYVGVNRKTNENIFDRFESDFRLAAITKHQRDSNQIELKYGREVIHDYIDEVSFELLQSGKAITTQIVKNLDGSEYLGGEKLHKNNGRVSAFVCRRESSGKISWFKELNLTFEGDDTPTDTEMTVMNDEQSGCTFILRSTHPETKEEMNTILTYDDKGKQVFGKKIDRTEYPRTLNFVEKLNAYVMSFYGHDRKIASLKDQELIIEEIDAYGNKAWEAKRMLSGNMFGLIITEDGFVVSGNYNRIKKKNGEIIALKKGQIATYILKINNEGMWKKDLLFDEDKNYITNTIFKVGDNSINVFGSSGDDPPISGLEIKEGDMVHYMVTKDLELISNSFE